MLFRSKAALIKRLLLDEFPWRAFLQDTCLAFDYGFAPFEIIWRLEDGLAKFRLALRPPSSIEANDIEVQHGAIVQVTQRPDTGGSFEIPGEKLVWFCHDKEGDNFRGRPILRAMFKPWYIKEQLEVELPELARKLGGIPMARTQGTPDSDTAAKIDTALGNFGAAAGSFLRFSSDDVEDIQVLTGSVSVADILEAIRQRNTEITSVCQAQVFDLGNAQNGSRALGSTLSDLFADSITAHAMYREDVLNARGGLIHQAVAYNFPTDDSLPKLRFGNVQAVDMLRFAQALVAFNTAFGTLDEETQDWARQQMNMPEGTTAQVVVEKPAPPAPAANKQDSPGADDADGADSSDDDGMEAQACECQHLHLAEMRAPRGVECFVELAEVASRFDDAKTAVRMATQRVRDKLVGIVIERALAAQKAGKLAQFAAQQPPMVDALRDAIKPVLAGFVEAGREQVSGELERQREGRPVVEEALERREAGMRVAAAEKKRKAQPLPDPDEAVDEAAEVAARAIAAQTQAAVAGAVLRSGSGVPMDPAGMAELATRESDAAALRMAGVASDLMNLGRATEAAEQAQDIETAVYSAILDGSLCDNCAPMDGSETTDLSEAAGWTPNPNCLGGDKCRCIVVYEIRQEATS